MGAQQIRYEAGQTQYGWTALTDSGDATTFKGAVAPWSDVGRDYVLSDVRAYGLATGGAVTGNGANDQVAVAALTAYMPGATGADLTTGLVNFRRSSTNNQATELLNLVDKQEAA